MSYRSALWGLLALAIAGSPASAEETSGDGADDTREVVAIAATHTPGEIVISLADRRLYRITARGRAISYPVATPRDGDLWAGTQLVTAKRVRPSWVPTPTMRRENPRLPAFVPGGHPMNPMGARALHLGHTYYRIHGTDAPWLIGQNVSKGCIRMHDAHVVELFEATPIGTRVTVVAMSLRPRTTAARPADAPDG